MIVLKSFEHKIHELERTNLYGRLQHREDDRYFEKIYPPKAVTE